MSVLARCFREMYKLFVDDAAQAVLVIIWVCVWCLLCRSWPGELWSGPVLFAGLAAIFAAGTL